MMYEPSIEELMRGGKSGDEYADDSRTIAEIMRDSATSSNTGTKKTCKDE